jgi:hypothetical protein
MVKCTTTNTITRWACTGSGGGIAAELGVRPLDVYAIWNLLLEHASRQPDRGSVAQFRSTDVAAQYDLEKSEVEAILAAFETRRMTSEGRVAKWEWYQRDLSTARVQKHREERRAIDEGDLGSPCTDGPVPKPGQRAETEMKRGETPETQEKKNKIQNRNRPGTTPPLQVVKGGREEDDAVENGTRADARAGSPLSEAELKKRKHDVVIQQVIKEAARTMPADRYDEFVLALCGPTPPRWAREERDRIWQDIRQRKARRAA